MRKGLAAVLFGGAVYGVSTALAPPPPDPGPAVLVAAEDLPVGTELAASTLRSVRVPEHLVPEGALTDPEEVAGSVTTAPLRGGEILTDLRVGSPLAGLDPDLVLAHLPLRAPDLAAVLQPGQRVDVLATTDGSTLARDVLLVQQVSAPESAGEAGYLVAVTPEEAGRLAVASADEAPGAGLTVLLRR